MKSSLTGLEIRTNWQTTHVKNLMNLLHLSTFKNSGFYTTFYFSSDLPWLVTNLLGQVGTLYLLGNQTRWHTWFPSCLFTTQSTGAFCIFGLISNQRIFEEMPKKKRTFRCWQVYSTVFLTISCMNSHLQQTWWSMIWWAGCWSCCTAPAQTSSYHPVETHTRHQSE